MKAITVEPKTPGSARYEDVPEPGPRDGSVLVEAVAVGVCGTDAEIVAGKYGSAPPGETRWCWVTSRSAASSIRVTARCSRRAISSLGSCAAPIRSPAQLRGGEWDMCTNGQYTERGIKEIHGFMSERWRSEPEYLIKVDPSLGILGVLLEPMTVITKAIEQVFLVGQRAYWEPKTALVTGAGPIGLLAALRLSVRRTAGPRARSRETGRSPTRARSRRDLSHRQRHGSGFRAGHHRRVHGSGLGDWGLDPENERGRDLCLTGVGAGGARACRRRRRGPAVLKNNVIVGSVNANKRHWYRAGENLAHRTATGCAG